MDWFKHILTGKDGETHDIARHSWLVTTATIIGATAWNAFHGAVVDLSQLAQAFGVNTAAHGAAIGFKAKTEPDAGKE